MKKDIRFRSGQEKPSDGNILVLVNEADDIPENYSYVTASELSQTLQEAHEDRHSSAALMIFVSVSIACAAAALATGSYAAWLSRQQSTRQTLTDVNEILRSCQKRMEQLEAGVDRLPNG